MRLPGARGFFPRIRWLHAFAWIVLPAFAWIGVGVLAVYVTFVLSGCVSASHRSGESTTWKPDGTVSKEKHSDTSFIDSTGVGQKIGQFVDGIDWSSLLSSPLTWVAGGGLGTLGAGVLKLIHSHGKSAGESKGWDDREKAAQAQQPLPATTRAT